MRRLAAITFLLLVPAAQAATVSVDKACYAAGDRVTATGQGFTPAATYTVFINNQQLGTGTIDAQGAFKGAFPINKAAVQEQTFTFAANDGSASANTTFKTAAPFVSFSPGTGNPRTLRVRFRGNGFGDKQVYLHYVLRGREVKRVALAKGEGECGSFNVKRKLLPFRYERGTYRLQYDTASKYSSSTPGAYKDAVDVLHRF